MAEDGKGEGKELAEGLRIIRRRRWYLWGLLLVYIPAIWISLEMTGSDRKTAYVFAVWFVLVFAAILAAAVAPARVVANPFTSVACCRSSSAAAVIAVFLSTPTAGAES